MGGFKEQYTSIQALAYKTNHILHKIHDEFQRALEEEKTCECDYEVASVQLFKRKLTKLRALFNLDNMTTFSESLLEKRSEKEPKISLINELALMSYVN
jgi:hypothetical protein